MYPDERSLEFFGFNSYSNECIFWKVMTSSLCTSYQSTYLEKYCCAVKKQTFHNTYIVQELSA